MAKIARIVPANLSHNVGTRFAHATHTLNELAAVSLVTEAAGQSRATLDAKRRDVQRKEAAGHQSDRSIWRYVTPDQQTRAEAMDALAERPMARPVGACHGSHRA